MKKLKIGLSHTFRTFVVIGFGPREEKEATNGADKSLASLLFVMVAVGLLQNWMYITFFLQNSHFEGKIEFFFSFYYFVVLMYLETLPPTSKVT